MFNSNRHTRIAVFVCQLPPHPAFITFPPSPGNCYLCRQQWKKQTLLITSAFSAAAGMAAQAANILCAIN